MATFLMPEQLLNLLIIRIPKVVKFGFREFTFGNKSATVL